MAFLGFEAAVASEEVAVRVGAVAPYEPGRFYLRELPCIRAALGALRDAPDLVIVDAHVWLDAGRPGLGARLFDELGGAAVVGVAKTAFRGAASVEVRRGLSKSPLYVSAVGIDANVAAQGVRAMHGPHRLPTLVKRADTLARTALRGVQA